MTTPVLVDTAGAAKLLGIAYSSVLKARQRGGFPEPDGHFGQSPVWVPSRILEWQAARPGRTGRPRKRHTPLDNPQVHQLGDDPSL